MEIQGQLYITHLELWPRCIACSRPLDLCPFYTATFHLCHCIHHLKWHCCIGEIPGSNALLSEGKQFSYVSCMVFREAIQLNAHRIGTHQHGGGLDSNVGSRSVEQARQMNHCTYHPPFCWQSPLFQIIFISVDRIKVLLLGICFSSFKTVLRNNKEHAFPPAAAFQCWMKKHHILQFHGDWLYTLQGDKGLRWHMTGVREDYFHREKAFFLNF